MLIEHRIIRQHAYDTSWVPQGDLMGSKVVMATKDTLFINDTHITFVGSVKYTGRKMKRDGSAYTWYKWVDQSKWVLKNDKHGARLLQYTKEARQPGRWLDQTWRLHTLEDEVIGGISPMRQVLPLEVIDVMQKFAPNPFPNVTGRFYPRGLALRGYKYPDFKDTVVHYFGKKNYRKDLVKACVGQNPNHVAWYSIWRNLVPIERIIEALTAFPPRPRMGPIEGFSVSYEQARLVRHILKQVSPTDRVRLLRGMPMLTTLRDMHAWYSRYGMYPLEGRYPDWDSVHNHIVFNRAGPGLAIMNGVNFAQNYGNNNYRFGVERAPVEKKIVKFKPREIISVSDGEYYLKAPEDSTQLSQWGGSLHNCMEVYDTRIDTESLIYGIFRSNDDRCVGALELQKTDLLRPLIVPRNFLEVMPEPDMPVERVAVWQLTQLLGPCNGLLPKPLHDEVIKGLQENHYQIGRNYVGVHATVVPHNYMQVAGDAW